jgi:hypothetical protein
MEKSVYIYKRFHNLHSSLNTLKSDKIKEHESREMFIKHSNIRKWYEILVESP